MLLVPTPSLPYQVASDDDFSLAVSATASGTAHTKGNWSTLISTIDYDIVWLRVAFGGMNTAGQADFGLADLGIGPNSGEVSVIAENLICGESAAYGTAWARQYSLPLRIPAGRSLFVRCQAAVTSDTVNVAAQGWGGPDLVNFPAGSYVAAIGANPAGSNGTSLTPGNSSAWGSFAQMDASSDDDYIAFLASSQFSDTTFGTASYFTGVGIGSATEDDLGVCGIQVHATAENIQSLHWPLFRKVPAATRIAMRMMCSGTTDTGCTGIVYGVRP